MKKRRWKHVKSIFVVALAVTVGVSFMPLGGGQVHAAGFTTKNAVAGFEVTGTTENTVSMEWDSYKGARGYQIYKAREIDGKYSKIKTISSTSFKRTGLTTNLTCYYKVRAYAKNSAGKTVYSKFSQISEGTPYGFSKKDKVGNFKVSSRTYNSVNFTWSPYFKAEGYQIYKATSKNGKYSKIKTTSSTSFKRTGLTTNLTCYYKVRAYGKWSDGKAYYSQFSSIISGTPKLSAPALTMSATSKSIKLNWAAVSGAEGYQVYRATSKSGTYSKVKELTGRSFTNTSIDKNKNYYYKVRAYRTVKGSKKYGTYASDGAITTPAQVKDVVATSTESGINLSWKAVSGASGYEILRMTEGYGTYTVVGEAKANRFSDVNVANGLTYFYKVRAYKQPVKTKIYGAENSSGYSRSSVVSTAVAWLGCKESNKSNKPIVDLYNQNMRTSFNYKTPWCAIFVSAVAIKSGTEPIIVKGSYCPTVLNTYKNSKVSNYSYASGKYAPKPGDVIFFDWNKNKVPDHTGMVASVSGNTVKTIEGNYSDAVGYRTFNVGWSQVLGYGLPNYDDASGVLFTGTGAAVGCGELLEAGIGEEPEGYADLGEEYQFVEEKVVDNIGVGCGEDICEYEKMTYMLKRVRANGTPENAECSESQYYSAFLFKLCGEAGVEASIVTAEDENGYVNAWIEAMLDGKWYRIYAADKERAPEEFTPEMTDIDEAEFSEADYLE